MGQKRAPCQWLGAAGVGAREDITPRTMLQHCRLQALVIELTQNTSSPPLPLSYLVELHDAAELAESIRRGDNRYTQTQGIAPLRERLRADLSAEFGRDVGEVLVTSGVWIGV